MMVSARVAIAALSLTIGLLCAAVSVAQEAPADAVAPDIGSWTVTQTDADQGAGGAVTVQLASNEPIGYLLGMEGPVTLIIQCASNNTSIAFDFGDNFMSDIADYGTALIGIDTLSPRRVALTTSSDKRQLGLFQGARAIPLISSLLNGETLSLSAAPLYGGSLDATFEIAGLREAITPLRQACRW